MGVHVESQVIDLVEGFVANGALVLLLPAVGQLVVLVVACERGRRLEKGVTEGAQAARCTGKAGQDEVGGIRKGLPPPALSNSVPVSAEQRATGTAQMRDRVSPVTRGKRRGSGLGPRPGTSHLKSI